MRYAIIFFTLLLISHSLSAQQSNVLSVSSKGSVDLPANVIQFNISLNAEADSPQKAYNLHKQREKILVQLLDKYEIEEKDIHFNPVSVSKIWRNNRYPDSKQEPGYQTQQSVSLRLTDFDIYEKMQVTLIEENFDSFSGNFLSSEAEQGKNKALQKAIQTAKEKAVVIAKEAGVKLGSIVHINYNSNQIGPVYARTKTMAFESDTHQLMKYDQTVTITANISIDFEIVH